MTAFETKREIEKLRNTEIPVLIRDQGGCTMPVLGVNVDLKNDDTELAFVIRVKSPEQPDLFRREDIVPLVKALQRTVEWLKDSSKPDPLAPITMALEHAKDLGLEDT